MICGVQPDDVPCLLITAEQAHVNLSTDRCSTKVRKKSTRAKGKVPRQTQIEFDLEEVLIGRSSVATGNSTEQSSEGALPGALKHTDGESSTSTIQICEPFAMWEPGLSHKYENADALSFGDLRDWDSVEQPTPWEERRQIRSPSIENASPAQKTPRIGGGRGARTTDPDHSLIRFEVS